MQQRDLQLIRIHQLVENGRYQSACDDLHELLLKYPDFEEAQREHDHVLTLIRMDECRIEISQDDFTEEGPLTIVGLIALLIVGMVFVVGAIWTINNLYRESTASTHHGMINRPALIYSQDEVWVPVSQLMGPMFVVFIFGTLAIFCSISMLRKWSN
ncbi:MAG: hypothetical protein ABJA67_08755 [Chthonomonadales bacterium]